MVCPQCGANTKPTSRFCPKCGHRLNGQPEPQGNQGSEAQEAGTWQEPPSNAPATPPANTPPTNTPPQYPAASARKKRSKMPMMIVGVVLLGAILIFAGFGLGIVPRFWESQGNGEDGGVQAHVDEENGIPLPNLEGCSESEARKRIEDEGLTAGKTIEHYSFAADSNNADKVMYAMVDGQKCSYSQKLKPNTVVDIVFVRRPNVGETTEYVKSKLQIEQWLKDDPSYFEGTWVYDMDLTKLEGTNYERNSNCDASSDNGRTPVLTIKKTMPDITNADVTLKALMHLHPNEKIGRHYGASDDMYEDVVSYFNVQGSTLVCSYEKDKKVLYWGDEKELVDKQGTKDEKKIKYTFGFGFLTACDVEPDEEGIKKVMGDDIAREYETEEEAMDAVVKACRRESYLVLSVVQDYNGPRTEICKMKKADEGSTTNS